MTREGPGINPSPLPLPQAIGQFTAAGDGRPAPLLDALAAIGLERGGDRPGAVTDPLERFRCKCVRCDRRGWLERGDEVAKASAKPRSRRSRRPVYASSWAEMLRAGLHPVTGQLLEDGERVA